MACYNPLHAYYRLRDDGKKDLVFVESNELPWHFKDGVLYPGQIDVPCGQCIGCRLQRSKEWALRCMLECETMEKKGLNSFFVTLTYDDEHLPTNRDLLIQKYGEIIFDIHQPTLVKSDPAEFIKRLRSRLSYDYGVTGMKVYYSGEYGDETGRPHYHLILFGIPDDVPLEFLKYDRHGFPLFHSPLLSDCWKKGFVVIGAVNFEACAYVARYVLKKQTGQASSFYDFNEIQPEFCEMSRRPGIGKEYYDLFKDDIYRFDAITKKGAKGKVIDHKPPRYFDKLFNYDDPDEMAAVLKKRHSIAKSRERDALSRTSLSKEAYLKLKEANQYHKIKDFIRDPERFDK